MKKELRTVQNGGWGGLILGELDALPQLPEGPKDRGFICLGLPDAA